MEDLFRHGVGTVNSHNSILTQKNEQNEQLYGIKRDGRPFEVCPSAFLFDF